MRMRRDEGTVFPGSALRDAQLDFAGGGAGNGDHADDDDEDDDEDDYVPAWVVRFMELATEAILCVLVVSVVLFCLGGGAYVVIFLVRALRALSAVLAGGP
jgi:hypothetical protein